MLNLDVGGDVGGRSVLWVAEGVNRGPRGLRVGAGERRGRSVCVCVCE